MNLECLIRRKTELEASAVQLSNSWQIIQGHKSEIDYWISELEKGNSNETVVDMCIDSVQ